MTDAAVREAGDVFPEATWAPHAWRRWMRRWPWYAIGAMALAVASWGWEAPEARHEWPIVLALTAALALWFMLWRQTLERGSDAQRRWALPLLAAGATVLSMALTHQSLSFWLLGLALLPLFFVVLPLPYALGTAMALTAHAGWESQYGGTGDRPEPVELLAFLLARTLLATLLGLFVRHIVRLADRRERLATELEATRGALAQASRHAGVMEERQRVARELHDTLTQGLSAVVMHLETAEQHLPPAASDSRLQLQRARTIARESLDDTRRVVASLRPELLDHAELPDAVARLCVRSSERLGFPVSCVITGRPVPLHPEAEITIFRALQEGLSNVRKHAAAHAVAVTLSYMDDVVMLDVRDDGCGFDPAALPPASASERFGLVAMRQRVEQLHGAISLESEHGEGTTLTIAVPLLHTAEFPTAFPQSR